MILRADGQSGLPPDARHVNWPPMFGMSVCLALFRRSRFVNNRAAVNVGTRGVHWIMYPFRCTTIARLGYSRRKTRVYRC